MWETCSVQLNVQLPQDMAEHVREVERSDPEFLSRIVLYGLTRRSIYQQLRQGSPHERPAPIPDPEEGASSEDQQQQPGA